MCAEQTVVRTFRELFDAFEYAEYLRNMAGTNSVSLFTCLPDAFGRGR